MADNHSAGSLRNIHQLGVLIESLPSELEQRELKTRLATRCRSAATGVGQSNQS
jgi:hypothetical protein